MPTQLHDLFQSLFLSWLHSGAAPGAAVEGVTPEFTGRLGDTQPDTFTFDVLLHATRSLGWVWQAIEFGDIFDGQFFLYVPADWSDLQHGPAQAVLGADQARRQSVRLLPRANWQPPAAALLADRRVTAFAYYPLWRPYYHQWVFVTAGEAAEVTAHGVYSSGDWLVVVEGEVPDGVPDSLNEHLTALVNSNPWYGWIQAAQAQQANSPAN